MLQTIFLKLMIFAAIVALMISPHNAQAAQKQPAPVISNKNKKQVIRKCNNAYKKCEAKGKRRCQRQASRGSREPLQNCIDVYVDDNCEKPYEKCLDKGKVP